MPTDKPFLARFIAASILLISLLIPASASLLANSSETEQSASIKNFLAWSAWADQASQFDLNRCRSLQVGDANGDGWDDVICPYDYGGNQNRTFVQFSAGSSLTGWASQHPSLLSQFDLNRCQPLLSGDVNNDDRTDLICTYDYGGNQTRTFVQPSSGMGNVGWQAWSPSATQFDINRCRSVQVGDANGDGQDDVICPYDYGGNQNRTFVQFSDGASLAGWTSQHPTLLSQFDLNRCRPLTLGDINADGRADLICTYDYGGNQTRTFVQPSSGMGNVGWQAWSPSATQFDINRCRSVQVGDANGDGQDDVICPYDYGGNQNRTFVQFSDGASLTSWTSQHPTLLSQFDLNRCQPLTLGDINADGRADLICAYDYGLNTRTFVQFAENPFTSWQIASPNSEQFDLDRCRSAQAADVDGDGHTDLFCPYDYGGNENRTFVQRAASYRSILPTVIR